MSCSKRNLHEGLGERSIPDRILQYSQDAPGQTAVIFLSGDGTRQTVTWQELYTNSVLYAKAFMAFGTKEQDVVAMGVGTQPEWLFIHFGLMFAGAIPFPIVFTYNDGSDVVAVLNKLETCSTIVMDPVFSKSWWNTFKTLTTSYSKDGSIAVESIPSLKHLVCTAKPEKEYACLSLQELLKIPTTAVKLPEIDPNWIAVLFQTSGSTGLPKAIAHTHKSIAFFNDVVMPRLLTADERKIFYNDRAFNWTGGWPFEIFSGSTRVCRTERDEVLTDSKNEVDFLIQAVQQEGCTTAFVLPPTLYELIERKESIGQVWPIKTIWTTGQPITKTSASCIGKLCSTFLVDYGSSETLTVLAQKVHNVDDFLQYSCGTAVDGVEIKIVDEHGQTVPFDTTGEIYVKTPAMFHGYYNDPQKTESVFTSDGWYRTDDFAKMTKEGGFFVEGRKSDMILSGGYNVPPAVVETVIQTCPGVKTVVIVPISDEAHFQLLCACFIPEDGSDVTEDVLMRYCKELHNDKNRYFSVLPAYYLLFASFPKTITGKISRQLLAQEAKRRLNQ